MPTECVDLNVTCKPDEQPPAGVPACPPGGAKIKPTKLVFRYTGDSCADSNNTQNDEKDGKFTCSSQPLEKSFVDAKTVIIMDKNGKPLNGEDGMVYEIGDEIVLDVFEGSDCTPGGKGPKPPKVPKSPKGGKGTPPSGEACFGCGDGVDGLKPEVITFQYLSGGACPGANTQGDDKYSCEDAPSPPSGPVTVTVDGWPETFMVEANGTFTFGEVGVKLNSNTEITIEDENGNVQTVSVHTSCSADFFIGDIFGSLKLIEYIGKGNVLIPCDGNATSPSGRRKRHLMDQGMGMGMGMGKKNTGKSGKSGKSGFTSSIMVMIVDPNEPDTLLQHLTIHTSCSAPLIPYETFGALQLLSATRETDPCLFPPDSCEVIPAANPFCDKSLKPFESIGLVFDPANCTDFEQRKRDKSKTKSNKGKKQRRHLMGSGGSGDDIPCKEMGDISAATTVHVFAYDKKNDWNELVVDPSTVMPGDSFQILGPILGNDLVIEACTEKLGGVCTKTGWFQQVTVHVSCSQPLFGVKLASFEVKELSGNGMTQSAAYSLSIQYSVFNPGSKTVVATVSRTFEQPCTGEDPDAEVFDPMSVDGGGSFTIHETIEVDNSVPGPVEIVAQVSDSENGFCDEANFTAIVSSSGSGTDLCDTIGKPAVITFLITGGKCSASNNAQDDDKFECKDIGSETPSPPLTVKFFDKDGTDITALSSDPGKAVGGEMGKKLDSETLYEIYQGSTLVQEGNIHTSCSQPLEPGNVFGALTLESWVTVSGDTAGGTPGECAPV